METTLPEIERIEPKAKFCNRRTTMFSLWCSLIGLGVGIYVDIASIGKGWGYFFLLSMFSAFVTSYLLWWLIIERKQKYSFARSVLIGPLSGLLAHYTTGALACTGTAIYELLTKEALPLSERLYNVISAPVLAFAPTLFSLMFFGAITIPAGFVIGIWYGKHCDDVLGIP